MTFFKTTLSVIAVLLVSAPAMAQINTAAPTRNKSSTQTQDYQGSPGNWQNLTESQRQYLLQNNNQDWNNLDLNQRNSFTNDYRSRWDLLQLSERENLLRGARSGSALAPSPSPTTPPEKIGQPLNGGYGGGGNAAIGQGNNQYLPGASGNATDRARGVGGNTYRDPSAPDPVTRGTDTNSTTTNYNRSNGTSNTNSPNANGSSSSIGRSSGGSGSKSGGTGGGASGR